MKRINYSVSLCVVGGGIAGICTALSAARHGIKTVLVHDRAVLGGNASSEIRMWICGSHGRDNRETGIVEELQLENFYSNPQLKYSLWDATLYDKVMHQENLTVLLNSSVFDADCSVDRINSVTAWQSNAQTFHTIEAEYFADCSGDSVLAPLSNAMYRYGRESKSDFNETIPPDEADNKTMGMSCLFQIRETDHKTVFTPPEWAYTYETDADLPYKDHDIYNNFWWIEVGGDKGDCVHDSDLCREELLKICYGVWDHIKNKGDHGADNWELEWIGFLPGKRESRRYIGELTVTQNDVEAEGKFDDLVAYAGWSMDDHFPEGFYYTDGYPTIFHPAPQPWGLPLRCMISKNIKNLTFAGRNISVTHAALSSSRVMATCGILGQALGTAIAQAVNTNTDIRSIDISTLQQTLMSDDCYLPWHKRSISALSQKGHCSDDIVRSGIDRGNDNCWKGKKGDCLEYTFDSPEYVKEIRFIFDSDLNRKYHNMPCNIKLHEKDFHIPYTLIKDYDIILFYPDRKQKTVSKSNNHQRFVQIPIGETVTGVRFVPKENYGCDEMRVFSFEVI